MSTEPMARGPVPGCEECRQRPHGRGFCRTHYYRVWRTGSPYLPTLRDRFERHFERRGPTECWPWLGGKSWQGYGRCKVKGAMRMATHVAWMLEHGTWPGKHQVLHVCDHPTCVNPAHLFLGSNDDNMRDKTLKGRAAKKLTPTVVQAMRRAYRAGAKQRFLAAKYGVNQGTVSRVLSRETWRHVEEQ